VHEDLVRQIEFDIKYIASRNKMSQLCSNILFLLSFKSANLIEMTKKYNCVENLLIHCSLTAQNISSDIIFHYQKLLNCNYSLEASDDER
jgi:hypothetical protein